MMARCLLGLVFVLAACQEPSAHVAARTNPSAVTPQVLSVEAQQLYQRTLLRDPVPTCAQLTQELTQPAVALLEVSERAVSPPWSSIRAAQCLVQEHTAFATPAMHRWVQTRETMGLGLLVLNQLDQFDAPLAQSLAQQALRGAYPEEARQRIERSTRHPTLRTLPSSATTHP